MIVLTKPQEATANREEILAAKIATTKALLAADRIRASAVLLALRYQLGLSTSTMEIK